MTTPLEEKFAKAVYLIRNGPSKNSDNNEKLKVCAAFSIEKLMVYALLV